jgi:hypothetical protein
MLDNAVRVNEFLCQYCRSLLADVPDGQMAEQPHAGVNHPAWILGHLTWTADNVVGMLGGTKMMSPELASLFARDSKPSVSRGEYASREELLRMLDQGYAALRQKAAAATPEQLARPTTNPRMKDVLPTWQEFLTFILTGHVGIHLGQLSAWRRMTGRAPLF